MDPRSGLVLKAFLTRLPTETQQSLLKFLPNREQEHLHSLPTLTQEISIDRFVYGQILDKVHWSWFLPTLRLYSESEQKLFLSALSPYAEKNLSRALTLSTGAEELSEIGKTFLKKILLDSLIGPKNQMLPICYFPTSRLTPLLELTKKELTALIDRLALYDLMSELRQIVETKILKKIYSLLTEEEKGILKKINLHQDFFSLGKLGMDKWDGSEESLRTLMHKRGLVRLGAALSGHDPDFIWTICHQLDIGRGSALHKLCMDQPIHGATEAIIAQIEEIL